MHNLSALKQITEHSVFLPRLFTRGIYFEYGMFGLFWATQLSGAAVFLTEVPVPAHSKVLNE